MATLIAIPIFGLLTILQSALISRIPLLHGTADLVLLTLIAWSLQEQVKTAWQWTLIGGLFIGFVSILPITVPIFSYAVITGTVLLVRRRIWEKPILAMFIMTFTGSIISQSASVLAFSITGTAFPLFDTLRLIILPSLLLNIILAAPVYVVIKDLAEWIYPEKIKV